FGTCPRARDGSPMTVRGGGVPYPDMVLMPSHRMGPPPRSLLAGPEQVLAYLSRYTHRVAISNSRLISADAAGVTFKYKDYRLEGADCYKTMTLEPGEFIRRFLMHVLPKGIHRIRHFGLLANGGDTR